MSDHVRPLNGTRILIVDDDQNSSRLLADFLHVKGAVITCENNGSDAIRRIDDGVFDLAILDLRLPEENGFVVTEHIRKKSDLPIPVIIVSAFADRQNRIRAFEAGADAFFSKPVDLQELLLVTANLASLSCLRHRYVTLQHLNGLMEQNRGTEGHGERVEQISTTLAGYFKVSGDDILLLRQAAALHDLGKIDETPGKPHWETGAEMIYAGGYLEKVALLVRHHHDFPHLPEVPGCLQTLITILQLAERTAETYQDSPAALEEDLNRGVLPPHLAGLIIGMTETPRHSSRAAP